MAGLTKGDRSRIALFKMVQGNPHAILAALDEIKQQAADAVQAAADDGQRKALQQLQTFIEEQERHYQERLDAIERAQGREIELKVRAIVPTKGEKGDKGDKGDAGYTPSDARLLALLRPLIPKVRDGIDGKTPTKEEIAALFKPLFAEAVTALNPTPEQKAEAEKALDDKIYGLITKGVAEQISQVKRFSGGGSGDRVEAGSGVTIETRASGKKRISVSGLYSVLSPTGSVDDSNTAFVFTEKPTEIVVNGVSYRENHGWTWDSGTLTATLASAVGVGGDIYGRK